MNSFSTQLFQRLATALRRQEGVSLVIILGVMLVTSLLVVATFTSANGEVHLTNTDRAQKKAYYAAEAGIEDYEYHLTQDGNYLTYCTTPEPENKALNQYYKEGTKTPLTASELKAHSVEVPPLKEGESSEEQYAIQLIPAESDKKEADPKCNTNNLVESMVEEEGSATGTFRVESTGFSGNARRSLVATFRNANFVSFVWYTMYEVGDPVVDGPVPGNKPSTYWAECGKYYEERESKAPQCKPLNNFFGTHESVNGPMHVQDHVGVCGTAGEGPVFGRSAADRIEFGNGTNRTGEGYSNEGCGVANATFKGTHIPPSEVKSFEPPPGDEELEHIVEENYHFYGKTEIELTGTTMTVIQHKGSHPTVEEEKEGKKKETTKTGVKYPPNGVIYVSAPRKPEEDPGTCKPYSPFGPVPGYTEDTECANVYVHGKYEESLTIAAENNVIINENITTPVGEPYTNGMGTPTSNHMLGLIANNFVRIYHPLTGTRGSGYNECGSATNDTTGTATIPKDLNEPVIYAAMLALKHAIIVDNFDCGAPSQLGHLNVFGALAGEFSNGLTGIIDNGTPIRGYNYNANYDNRLQVEEPPHFLNPIQASWYIQRQTLASEP